MNQADLPSAFTRLFDERRFDYWGAPYANLTEGQRAERIRAYRDRVLWWKSIEWDRAPNEIVVADGGDGWLRPGLIAFAGNGHGDQYCWYPRWQVTPAEPPVLFVPHDELEATLFARSFGECLLRGLLQNHAGWDAEWDGDEDERRTLWIAHASIVRPFLDDFGRAQLVALGDAPSSEECEAADELVAKQVGPRTVVGTMLPTRYNEEYLRGADLVRAYTESAHFYRELVEDERLEHFRGKLEGVLHRLAQVSGASE